MIIKKFAIIGLFVLCSQCRAQPAANPKPAASARLRSDYARRISIIVRDTQFSLSAFFVSWDQMERANAPVRRRESEEEFEAKKRTRDQARVGLLKAMPTVRANAKRLRSVSPVPRIYKKADDHFIDAGYSLDASMRNLELWLVQPSDEWKSQTEKHYRKALAEIFSGQRVLAERSESGVVNKTYAE